MPEKVLVTYATKYGSTQGVAEVIAAELRNMGLDADLLPAANVQSISGYHAVVLGTPLYIGSMLSDASKFLSRFKKEISEIPSALFVLGPLYNTPKDMTDAKTQLDIILNKITWFKPVTVEVFTGAMDPDKFRFPDSLLKMMPASQTGDIFKKFDGRDWDAIKSWSSTLENVLLKQTA
ncbi:flavodoxin [Leptolinea sp. HRD-7]|jgi:menaquinone-dependent protoporphyrinogen oxidase|nr:flavodoxin [Leptolinea sp. HRD-7]